MPGAARMQLRDLLPRGGKIISTEHFLLFNQELLALVKAGLPILQSFDIMLERQKNLRFKEVLTDVREKLKSGIALSDAFASYGDAFPPIYSTSLRAGERSGDLEGVLRRFLRYQKIIVNLRKRVIGALIYPARPGHPLDRHGLHHADEGHPEVRRVLRRLRRRAAVVHAAS